MKMPIPVQLTENQLFVEKVIDTYNKSFSSNNFLQKIGATSEEAKIIAGKIFDHLANIAGADYEDITDE